MNVIRLVIVALVAYSAGTRDWDGAIGSALVLALLELGVWSHGQAERRRAERWHDYRRPS